MNPNPVVDRDPHSFSEPHLVRVRDVALDLEVHFDRKTLAGTATLSLEQPYGGKLALDTRDLQIEKAESSTDGAAYSGAPFELGKKDPVLGTPLTVVLPPGTSKVRIRYATSPAATALQWLAPQQTAGRKHPFLFTQSQAIHARSWIPLQDTPGVRVTYSARIKTPGDLLAVMSAENDANTARNGEYMFRMPQPIPSYLIALGAGDLAFRPLGKRTGVYAEPPVADRAAREFEDTEKMVEAVEKLYGPYRWGRYDLLVLPPSFPYGGMENPRLTFATPTILAGDKSLVALIAHELAHSWSGNLVTNATWSDFWLNEGFTVYLERRIQELVYGRERAEMEAVLGYQDLLREFERLPDGDEILHIDLKGRDPDEGTTQVPYEKGALFLKQLELIFGRERFDEFLRGYFDHFAFQSITTARFVEYLKQNLLDRSPGLASRAPLEDWIYKPGLPPSAPLPFSQAFVSVGGLARRWTAGEAKLSEIPAKAWTTQEWLHFLRSLPPDLGAARMRELDRAFRFTRTGNYEILQEWLLRAIRNGYGPANRRLDEFLLSVGRRKYVKPLYEELARKPEGRQRAEAIYSKARPMYHPITAASIDEILKK